jgi:hypothetical protein
VPSWGTAEIEERVKSEMVAHGLAYDDKLAAKRERGLTN